MKVKSFVWLNLILLSIGLLAHGKSITFNDRFSVPDKDYHISLAQELKKLAIQYKACAQNKSGQVAETLFSFSIACLEEARTHEQISNNWTKGQYYNFELEEFDPNNEYWIADIKKGNRAANKVNTLYNKLRDSGFLEGDDLKGKVDRIFPKFMFFSKTDRIKKANALRVEADLYKNEVSSQKNTELATVLSELSKACLDDAAWEEEASNGSNFLSLGEQEKSNLLVQHIEDLRQKAVYFGYTLPPESKSMSYISTMHRYVYNLILKSKNTVLKNIQVQIDFYKKLDDKGSPKIAQMRDAIIANFEKMKASHERIVETLQSEHSVYAYYDSIGYVFDIGDELVVQLKELRALDPTADPKLYLKNPK